MKIICNIDSEGNMEWQGQEALPPALFDKLEDAFACFPRGSTLSIDCPSDSFCEF